MEPQCGTSPPAWGRGAGVGGRARPEEGFQRCGIRRSSGALSSRMKCSVSVCDERLAMWGGPWQGSAPSPRPSAYQLASVCAVLLLLCAYVTRLQDFIFH